MKPPNDILRKIDIRLWKLQTQLREVWPKYLLKRKIKSLPPLRLEEECEIVVAIFCGKEQVAEGLASCYSFYKLTDKRYPLYWFDDGTLCKNQMNEIKSIFPNAQIIVSTKSDVEVGEWLRKNDCFHLAELRKSQVFGKRLTDINFYLNGKAVLLLDSDVLFLQSPVLLLNNLRHFEETNNCKWVYNVDVRESYCTTIGNINEASGLSVVRDFNAGLFFFKTSLDNLVYLESICANGLSVEKLYYWEQTLFAILATKHKADPLPGNYDVHFRLTGNSVKRMNAVSRHYCSDARPFFYKDFEILFRRFKTL